MDAQFFKLYGFTFNNITNPGTGDNEILVNSIDLNYRSVIRWNHYSDLLENDWIIYKERLLTLIFNKIDLKGIVFNNLNHLKDFIENNFINFSPEQKSNNLLRFIKSLSNYEGERVSITRQKIITEEIWRKFYFTNVQEMEFYLKELIKEELLSQFGPSNEGFGSLSLTKKGLISFREFSINANSNNCFVAMAFTAEMEEVYKQAIYPAIIECGFTPFQVNERLISTEKTINDEIIAGIKMSKFMIADFTSHRNGVYFEAGLGRGLGMEVIYTCKRKEIKKAHFDTRQYQHILWSNSEELKVSLINRINALLK
jgi:hypothetical protein